MDLFSQPESPDEPRAHARWTDPETSHEAAASVKDLRESQQAVLEVFDRAGRLYDEQLIELYQRSNVPPKQSVSGIRTRRAELVAAGKLIHVGYAHTNAGRRTRVWARTP